MSVLHDMSFDSSTWKKSNVSEATLSGVVFFIMGPLHIDDVIFEDIFSMDLILSTHVSRLFHVVSDYL